MAKAAPSDTVVHVKVTLDAIRPAIWRRLVMPVGMSLGGLHYAIQAAMGWDNSHMHMFEAGRRRYGNPGPEDFGLYDADEDETTLEDLIDRGVNRFTYTYDFGDDWRHAILIEKRRPPKGTPPVPACVAGARACPIEDCGGPWGYMHLLDVIGDPDHPEYGDMIEWVDEDFDAEAFSVEDADAMVAGVFGRR